MRILKFVIFAFIAITLTACNTTKRYGFLKDETKSYQEVRTLDRPVVIPQNLSANNMQNYYEVPEAQRVRSAGADPQPSMLPPGSRVQQTRYSSQQDRIRLAENAKIQGHTSAAVTTQYQRPVTTVGMNSNTNIQQAWMRVGRALQSARYKIVERDPALGTYYVIDTRSTGGKMKKDMPIYQVHLKGQGQYTTVTVSPANPILHNVVTHSLY